MSGPYCETCKFFYLRLPEDERGECTDPSKRIYSSAGDPVNEPPDVYRAHSCSNHAALAGAK